MYYMGSKARHAKHIIPFLMNGHDQSNPYIEPFVGGGNMIDKVPAEIRWGSDTAEYAIALLDALSEGWVPPETLSEEEYNRIKESPHDYAKELVGFAAYPCSFGAKFWGGYGRRKLRNERMVTVQHGAYLNAVRQMKLLSGVKFTVANYSSIVYPECATVYCDPPYAGTTGYKSGAFDHAVFWDWAEKLSPTRRVFVSEYTAPDNWECIWEKETPSSLDRGARGDKRNVERLFTLRA